MDLAPPDNESLAATLDRVGSLLEAQGASSYRSRAYFAGAQTVRQLSEPVAALLEREGLPGLIRLPHVGKSIAHALAELIHSGRLGLLQRLEGEVGPEALIASLPGVGPTLAHRIHEELGVSTLEQLEVAAHDGRLETVPGVGRRRSQSIRELLSSILGRRGRPRAELAEADMPPVALLLQVDASYLEQVEQDALPRIAPRRFNPEGRRWLPVLHVDREGWHFTALFSNTERAHRLGRTHDWVVIFFEREGVQGQVTVVSQRTGALAGRRVVRGHELACERHYRGG